MISNLSTWWCTHASKCRLFLQLRQIDPWARIIHHSIAWIRAVRHKKRTAVPHICYRLRCMLGWSLSGHWSVCINHSVHNFKGWLRKTLNKRHFHLIYICCTNSIQVLNLDGFLCRFRLWPSIYILKINEKMLLVLGPQCKQSLVHKTCQLNQTAANQIVQILPGPPPHKMQMGHPHTENLANINISSHRLRFYTAIETLRAMDC